MMYNRFELPTSSIEEDDMMVTHTHEAVGRIQIDIDNSEDKIQPATTNKYDDEARSRCEDATDPTSKNMDTTIMPADVLCGRGKISFNHVGNKVFRKTVSSALNDFIQAKDRNARASVINRIVETIQTDGGRFLKKDKESGQWYELSDAQAKEKVGHAVRDALNTVTLKRTGTAGAMSKDDKDNQAIKVIKAKQKAPRKATTQLMMQSSKQLEALHHVLVTNATISETRGNSEPTKNFPDLDQTGVVHLTSDSIQMKVKSDDVYLYDPYYGDEFLDEINKTLGPLPPGAIDPMESINYRLSGQ